MVDILFIIAAVWLFAASVTDLKKSEVSDWLSFSLLAIGLSVRAAESVVSWNYQPILASVLGVMGFFIIANIFYYGKLFAGGDAKLMIALGSIIPSFAFLSNLLIVGSAYGLLYSLVLAAANHRRFFHEFKKHGNWIFASFVVSAFLMGAYVLTSDFIPLFLSITVFFMPLLFFFVNSVEKSCLIRKVSPEKLTVGDWLFRTVKIKGKTIRSDFEGLSKSEISLIRKSGIKVYVKYGIPFIPVFLIAFVSTVYFGNLFLLLV